jgi:transposase
VTEVSTTGLDIAKQVFHVHAADAAGRIVFVQKITWSKLMAFVASRSRYVAAFEACGGAHYWDERSASWATRCD